MTGAGLVILILSLAVAPRIAEQRSIALVDALVLDEETEPFRAELFSDVVAAIEGAHWEVQVINRGECGDVSCASAVAARFGAGYAMVVGGRRIRDVLGQYDGLRVDLIAPEGRFVGTRAEEQEPASRDHCSTGACSFSEVRGKLARYAGALIAVAPSPASEHSPPPSVVRDAPLAAPKKESPAGLSAWRWAAVGGGVLGIGAVATGAIFWSRDGDTTTCDDQLCRRHTKGAALSLTGAGLVLVGVGVWTLFAGHAGEQAAVTIGPSSLAFVGKF